MNTNDENLKKSQLLQLAQQGNEEALAQLFNQLIKLGIKYDRVKCRRRSFFL
ncbi:hypothetical protein [[Phormidium ambiguum] IAM M-71]|uniref:hypothetical protein n=1 Tax=[Phormidium ambiguum] IAM M-71 TaxID=454136 RepID=UPI0015BEDEB5|nr:hypothetical protein [Phormidium ambiguum]